MLSVSCPAMLAAVRFQCPAEPDAGEKGAEQGAGEELLLLGKPPPPCLPLRYSIAPTWRSAARVSRNVILSRKLWTLRR